MYLTGLKVAAESDRKYAAQISAAYCAGDDSEGSHKAADKILCEILKELGFIETVKAFEAVEKWYA